MKNAQIIIDLFGGLEQFTSVTIENPGWMRLSIERIGEGPRNLPLFSIAHYGKLNGDLMADPEMTFEVGASGWLPVSFRNDYASIYQEGERGAVFTDNGKVMIRLRLVRELASFARTWNRNLKDQGFIKAAQAMAA